MSSQMMRVPLRVIDLLRHANRNHPLVEIVSRRVEGDTHRYTYADAYRRVCQLARALDRLGISQNARVGTLAWNGYRHLELYYACAGLGAICHTLNPRLAPQQIAWIAQHANDEILFFDATFAPLVASIRAHLPRLKHVVLLGGPDSSMSADAAETIPGLLYYETLIAGEIATEVDWPSFDENQACGLCYTSGTTGDPKGVCYSNRSSVLHAYAAALPDSLNLSVRDVVLPVVPMFHVNAWGLPYAAPMVGAKLVLPGPALDGKSLYSLCEAEHVTIVAGVPTIWLGVLDHLRTTGQSFSSLNRTVIGGSAASEAMIREFEETHNVRVIHAWGMTEVSPIGAVNQFKPIHDTLDADARYKLQTKQGREPFGIEMRIEAENGEPVPRDGAAFGRLLVRGPWVVGAYEGGVPAARADGWFDTGDVATIDDEGYMAIVDRSKDVIKSGGEWISSIELENAAMGHPALQEVAVIAVPHAKWIERPLMVCVLRPGRTLSSAALLGWLGERVARWWLPDAIVFVDELPHGATGKLLKNRLREQYANYAPAEQRREENCS
ncbi:long-chain-fatty-acid--CoA ligase [Ralstonia soli]|uniref:Long-chain-fatty-acid--CoA ligase n=1 Tax=Ralstonia soli TaxID=2953896 RepID=A0ABT1ANA5_9RALS|nr:long-chain-fatty-acid--CoA ligase [Ralstonia soli]MCO5399699.1 long-chain-fatty-acid--CoA ligase [Ralstonia soli]